MATLGTAYVQVIPSTEGIASKLEQGVGTACTPAGKKGGAMLGGAIAKYVSVAAIGTAIKKSVEEGAKLEQSLGGVETLYKKHADTVIKNANKAYKTAGLSANDYMEQSTKFAASLLQSLGGDTKAAAKYADMAIIDMSDNANKFGTNIEDIQNAYQGFSKQNYTMLDNLKLGYGGTKSEMERLLKDASKISGQEYDIENLNDVYDAIHVIQTEMGVTGTTSKEAASTLSGSFASMKSAATNFMGALAIGEGVGSALKGLLESANIFLFDNLVPALMNIAKEIPGAAIQFVQTAIPSLLNGLATWAPEIIQAATGALNEIRVKLFEALSGDGGDGGNNLLETGKKLMLKIVKGIIDNLPDLLIAAVKLILAFAKFVLMNLPTFVTIGMQITWAIVKGLGGTILAKVGEVAGKIKDKLLEPIQKAKDKIKKIIKKIKDFFPVKIGKIFKGMKLPHFTVSGGKAPFGIGGMGTKPKISVKWYAKGGIMNSPTLFGGGEAGPEAIVPLAPFWNKMDTLADNIVNGLNVAMAGGGTGGNITVVTYLYPSGPKMDEYVYKSYERAKTMRKGR